MRYFVFDESDTYEIAILIKGSAFNRRELERAYLPFLNKAKIPLDTVVFLALEYNEQGKAPAKHIKAVLDDMLPQLNSIGTQYLYCADAAFFKAISGYRKAEPPLGYAFPVKYEGCETMQVTLGVNHRSLIYNPANEGRLALSMDTLVSMYRGNYEEIGADIIKYAEYPKTTEAIAKALASLHKYSELSCDAETFSLKHDKAGIGTLSFAWSQHEGIAFPCDYKPLAKPENGVYGEFVINPEVRGLIKKFFEEYEGNLRFHNATFDVKVAIATLWMKDLLDTEGLLTGLEILTRDFDDTKVIAYLATNSTAGNDLRLKSLAHPFAGNWAQDEIKDIRRIPLGALLQYNLVDALATNYVFDTYYPKMVADEQEKIYRGLMLPSLKTIIQVELTGMPLNPTRVQEVRKELEAIVAEQLDIIKGLPAVAQLEELLTKRAWEKDYLDRKSKAKNPDKIQPKERTTFPRVLYNPNSGPQNQVLLYEILGLPVIDFTNTGAPATGKGTLEKLVNHTKDPSAIAALNALVDYSAAEKILSTFIPAFEAAIEKGDQVVWLHGSFNLGGTVSGRLSSSDPNLQNIPSGSVYGKLIKSCFQAPEGWLFCGADFNSLEDYISALTTKDPNKLKVYLEGYDGHCLRAYSYWPERFPDIELVPESVNKIKKLHSEIRQASKAPTFALTYQGTWKTLMNNCGFSEEEAKKIEARYHELYKVSDEWVQARLAEASKTGYVTVAFGLRVRTPLIQQVLWGTKKVPPEAKAEGRTAGNALGQSYGQLTNRALNAFMEKVWASPFRYGIKPVAMIHDAIYLVIRNTLEVVDFVNRHLIQEMRWQELPEIQHDSVKIGAELSIFWPTWADELVLPNEATLDQIVELSEKHQTLIQEKQAA